METFRLPEAPAALIFDMDNTLYTHPEYARAQIDLPVRRLAEMRGMGFEELSREIAGRRAAWAAEHGGAQISLGNIFRLYGISIEETVRWREELYRPEDYLRKDPRLRESLCALGACQALRNSHKNMSNCTHFETPLASFALALVTNNPVVIARRTLAVLGVEDLFPVVIGLDTCGVSKPHAAPFLMAAELLGVLPASCVSVGDRYDIDIALPLDLGMGGVLVAGVEEVYCLPDLFGGGLKPLDHGSVKGT